MIQTCRCNLYELKQSDFVFYKTLLTNISVRKYLGGVQDTEALQSKFEKLLRNSSLNLIVSEKRSGNPIGILYVDTYCDGLSKELSYEFIDSSWGKGYAYECILEVLNYLKHNSDIKNIIAETQSKNLTSVKLLQKLDFSFQEEITRHGEKQKVYMKII